MTLAKQRILQYALSQRAEGKPLRNKQLESPRQKVRRAGSIHGAIELPFYTAAETARGNLGWKLLACISIQPGQGKYHCQFDTCWACLRPDGTVGARFMRHVNVALEKDEVEGISPSAVHTMTPVDVHSGHV